MESSGLVKVHRVGNQKHYQANHVKTFGVANVLRIALQPLWPVVELAFVYGFLAKGAAVAIKFACLI